MKPPLAESDKPQPTLRNLVFIEPEMVVVPAGEALLGGDYSKVDEDENPVWTATIAAFALAIYPVTNAEYRGFISAGGYDHERWWSQGGKRWLRGEGQLDRETEAGVRAIYRAATQDPEAYIESLRGTIALDDIGADFFRTLKARFTEDEYVESYVRDTLHRQRHIPTFWHDFRFNQPTQPVVGINWYEAAAYAAWLAWVTGKAYRLPIEAEWAWAARRKSHTQPERRYPWGDEWDATRCNSLESRLNQPTPVGIYPRGATPDGLHDLAGNIYEWTASLYHGHPSLPTEGVASKGIAREGISGIRVMRGGSWTVGAERVHCAHHLRRNSQHSNGAVGFRLARDISGE